MSNKRNLLVLTAAIGAIAFTSQLRERPDEISFSSAEMGPSLAQAAAELQSVDNSVVESHLEVQTPVPVLVDDAIATIAPRAKMSGPVAAIAAAGGDDSVQIIVRYDQHPELFDDERVARLGGEVTRRYEALSMRVVRIPAAMLDRFASDENVDWLSLDEQVSATSVASRETANVPTGSMSNAAYSGSSVGVAMLDTGVAGHADLAGYFLQFSFLGGAYPQPELRNNGTVNKDNDSGRADPFGHGTHVAGILTGSGDDSKGNYTGVSTGATFLSLQVLSGLGTGSVSDVMGGIDWLLTYGALYNIRVVNLSLGKAVTESNKTDPLVLAVESLWDAGYVVVVAAGNFGHYGNLTITSPANSRKVITVGSLTDNGTGTDHSDDYVSTYSSLGPSLGDYVVKPDLVAPGNRLVASNAEGSLLSTLLASRQVACTAKRCNSSYLELSGTSMATPMVGAAAALMLQKDPSLTPATVKARLMRSARKIDSNFVSSGAGLLDVDAAMNEFGVVTGDALSPLMYVDSLTSGVVVEDTAVLWGDSIWGTGFIWTDGGTWTNGFSWTDADGVTSNGFAWTDGASVNSSGFGWTDGGVHANGFGWTDGGVNTNGFAWTNYVYLQQLFLPSAGGLILNDDPNVPTSGGGGKGGGKGK